MSELGQKRTISETEIPVEQTPKKKRKLPFTDEYDQEQFEEIFESLQSTELIDNLNVPSYITSDIAQYSTGFLKDCSHCAAKIVLLYEDGYDEFQDTGTRCKYYLYCTDAGYFCSECMVNTAQCDCGEWVYVPPNANHTCEICNYTIPQCAEKQNFHCNFSVKSEFTVSLCSECEKCMCYQCYNQCDDCGHTMCKNCVDKNKSGKYSLYKCNECANCIPTQHEHCKQELPPNNNFVECQYSVDHEHCEKIFCTKCEGHKNNMCACCENYFCEEHGSNKIGKQCAECQKNVCIQCEKWCKECKVVVCDKCFDEAKTGKYMLTACKECDNDIGKMHDHCREDWMFGDRRPIKLYFEYCAENGCKALVCSKCEKNKSQKCKDCATISYFCDEHDPQNLNWTCLWCQF